MPVGKSKAPGENVDVEKLVIALRHTWRIRLTDTSIIGDFMIQKFWFGKVLTGITYDRGNSDGEKVTIGKLTIGNFTTWQLSRDGKNYMIGECAM